MRNLFFVLNTFWHIILCFPQLDFHLNIFKYPKFSFSPAVLVKISLRKCKIILNSPKCPKRIVKKRELSVRSSSKTFIKGVIMFEIDFIGSFLGEIIHKKEFWVIALSGKLAKLTSKCLWCSLPYLRFNLHNSTKLIYKGQKLS